VSFDANALLLSLITGGVGFVLFVDGKKQNRWPQMVAGIAFMVYPYFVSSVGATLAIAAGLGVALWWAIRAGW